MSDTQKEYKGKEAPLYSAMNYNNIIPTVVCDNLKMKHSRCIACFQTRVFENKWIPSIEHI